MRHIVDGHEYRTTMSRGHIDLVNNYGTLVAVATLSPCDEYWGFETLTGIDCGACDEYHINSLGDVYSVEQQLARWFSVASE